MKKALLLLPLLLSSPLLADEVSSPWSAKGMPKMLIICGAFFALMYFVLLRPEQKRRKKMEHLQTHLSKGDCVTAMGMVGTVSQLKEKTVVLKMVEGAKIEVLKGAISEIRSSSEDKQSDLSQIKTNKADA